ncbi:MAG: helix-turn-helix transcriptional regulator [Methanomassiliicoccales archaeon]|nr:MAG: helix-turn-helix transcriptional regulator [Methanomassiliicoccales archaeon]
MKIKYDSQRRYYIRNKNNFSNVKERQGEGKQMGQTDMNPIEASKIITDEYSAKILVATYKRPKSALELSHRFGIPIAACYRRIHLLEKVGLLTCVDKVLTQKGKRIKIYLSQLKNAYIFFEKGKLRVRFELKTGTVENFGGEWTPMDDSSEDYWPSK